MNDDRGGRCVCCSAVHIDSFRKPVERTGYKMFPVSDDVKEMKDEDIERFINANNWTFAKTMPENPHWYIVRDKCSSEEDFKGFVMHIRKHGYRVKFKGSWYTCFDVGEYKYWTM